MRIAQAVTVLALAFALASCARGPTLDASSPETLRRTSEQLRQALPETKRGQYDAAVMMVIVANVDPVMTIELAARGTQPTQASVVKQLEPVLDGRNADDVIALGRSSTTKVQQQLQAWKLHATGLNARLKAYEAAQGAAQLLQPVSAELRTMSSAAPLLGDNVVSVAVTLRNNLDYPVAGVSLELGLMPPTVTQPWVVEPFTATFKQAVPPGGQVTVTVGPTSVNIPDVFKGPVELEADIKITSVQSGDGKQVDLPRWSQGDTINLAKLESAIAEVESTLALVKRLAS